MEMTDWQLVRKFADDRSQAAFSELTRRYTNLVYRVCLRELGDQGLAEDAAQAVFLLLAQKAPSLRPARHEATLSSWLFQTALLTARNVRRSEQRRAVREQEATQMQADFPHAPEGWTDIEPLLNDALHALPSGQRTLILVRYFQDRPLAEIGAGLGVSEDAARMRVNRALDRLRRFFAARNVTLSAAALAALLPNAIHPAPAHAADLLARLPLLTDGGSSAPTHAQTIAQGAIHTMNLNRLRLQLGAATLVAVFVLGTAGAVRVTSERKAQAVRAEQQQSSAQALAIMDRMYATYAAMKSFKCEVETQESPNIFAEASQYEIERPNKIRFRQNSLFDAAGSGQQLEVSDGNNLYVTSTEPFEKTHGLADSYAKMDFVKNNDYSAFFADFGGAGAIGELPRTGMPEVVLGLRLGVIHLGADEEVITAPAYSLGQPTNVYKDVMEEQVPVDVVVAQMHQRSVRGRKDVPIVVTYSIGQSDHLLYKLTEARMFRPNEWDTETQKIYGQSINPLLPMSDFVFTPPPSSHEVRDTSDLFPGGRG